jgi:sugar lactone lactonase YvrE
LYFRHLAISAIGLLLAASLIAAPAQADSAHRGAGADRTVANLLPLLLVAQDNPAFGEPPPRVTCPEGFEVLVYATDLESPGGLALDPNDVLYVAEENAGRVSRVGPDGTLERVVTGLDYPEGIAFDPAGNLYVVEDVKAGRLLRIDPQGQQTVLAEGLAGPEGVVWAPDDHLYVTESNVQFIENIPWDVISGVTRVSASGEVTEVLTDALLWSYSAITRGADGLLYVANEASNTGTTNSIFQVDPLTGARTLFTSDLTSPEGVHFSPGGVFPLYATEEDLGDGTGRLNWIPSSGIPEVLCTGLYHPEGVAVDSKGNLYVTDQGLILQILVPDLVPPGPPQQLVVNPTGWTAAGSFALSWVNPADASGIAGAYLKLGAPPAAPRDGTFYAEEALTQITGINVVEPGSRSAYLWLEDDLGNADHANAAQVTLNYDPEPPGSPLELRPEPSDWSPSNSFQLRWSNPPELSGVTTACYRLDQPPPTEAHADGCQTGAQIEVLADVSVPGSGEHTVFAWLADAVGNVDPATAISATLRLDSEMPTSVASAPASTKVAPIQVTWVATDTHSGLAAVALWVKRGREGTWLDTGLLSVVNPGSRPVTAGQGFFHYQPSGQATYFFATRAMDRAGNSEAEPEGEGDAQTECQTWQWVYLPLLLKGSP